MIERLQPGWTARVNTALILAASLVSAWAQGSPRTTFYDEAKTIIEEVRPTPSLARVDDFLAKLPKISESSPLKSQAESLAKYVFETVGIEADTGYLSRSEKDNVLPDSVLEKKKGHCVGLTTLYLLAGERLSLPVYLVRGPDHVFPRLCRKANPSECVNIETLKKGLIIEDDFYKTNLTIPKSALESGIYLKSLSDPKELSASLYLGLGYITAQAKQTAVAELFYKKAIAKSPTFADAYSNLASIQAELGDSKEIETLLKKAIALNPTHYATLLNLGVLQFKKGDLSEAITFYSKAIESNPLSVHAYRRRALALKQGNQLKAALLDLDRILVIQPKFCDVQEERNSISKKLGKHIDAKALKELAQLRAARACLMLAQ